jgi:hypothetical protein
VVQERQTKQQQKVLGDTNDIAHKYSKQRTKKGHTFAGESKCLFKIVKAGDGLFGRTLSEQVPGEEAGKVLDGSVDLVATDCGCRKPKPWLNADDGV